MNDAINTINHYHIPTKRKAFDGLLPGKPLCEFDPSELSPFEKLKALLGATKTKDPDIISYEDIDHSP